MNIQATTKDEYFAKSGEREPDLRTIDQVIRRAAPDLEPVLFQGMGGGAALGYGLMDYQTKSMKVPTKWPLIALANQKHHMSLYICAVDTDGQYFAEKYAERLGKVDCGKSCIRFKKADDLDMTVLEDILSEIASRVRAGEKLFGI